MSPIRIAALWVLCLGLATFQACSKSNEPVVEVAADDAEMNAAISAARESLPDFWSVFDSPQRGETDFLLKVKFEEGSAVEHIWLTDLRREEGKIFGVVDNDPAMVTTVKLGEEIEVPSDDITDWMYMREGKIVGNFTLRPLFKEMPPEEVEFYKANLADP